MPRLAIAELTDRFPDFRVALVIAENLSVGEARSAVSTQTRRAALTVQSNGSGDVEEAAARLVALIERECGGRCRVVVADRARTSLAF
jgi:hypothetical protein